jgi:hypothetical protein
LRRQQKEDRKRTIAEAAEIGRLPDEEEVLGAEFTQFLLDDGRKVVPR